MAKLYGIGAAVVIIGAMFKIQHWPFASLLLVVGLSTEAVIFFFSAFEPPHEEVDWSLVYPELAGGDVAIVLGNNAPTTWTAPANPVVVETPVNETPAPAPSGGERGRIRCSFRSTQQIVRSGYAPCGRNLDSPARSRSSDGA